MRIWFITNKVLFLKKINNRWTIKSGADFKSLSRLELTKNGDELHVNKIEKIVIDSSVPENIYAKIIVDSYIGKYDNILTNTYIPECNKKFIIFKKNVIKEWKKFLGA